MVVRRTMENGAARRSTPGGGSPRRATRLDARAASRGRSRRVSTPSTSTPGSRGAHSRRPHPHAGRQHHPARRAGPRPRIPQPARASGALLVAAADLLGSTSVNTVAEGFPEGFWNAATNPGARLLACGGHLRGRHGGRPGRALDLRASHRCRLVLRALSSPLSATSPRACTRSAARPARELRASRTSP